jgi:hypothetical protein
VPPAVPQIKLPTEWMKTPVSDTANNWVEVEKNGDSKFSAEVGKENVRCSPQSREKRKTSIRDHGKSR